MRLFLFRLPLARDLVYLCQPALPPRPETLNSGRRGRAPGRLPMDRMILVIVITVIAETAWALFCAETGVNLIIFYAVLVAISALFWLPDQARKREASIGELDTKR